MSGDRSRRLAARLLAPVAVALDPFATGRFNSPAVLPWPDRVSNLACGTILALRLLGRDRSWTNGAQPVSSADRRPVCPNHRAVTLIGCLVADGHRSWPIPIVGGSCTKSVTKRIAFVWNTTVSACTSS